MLCEGRRKGRGQMAVRYVASVGLCVCVSVAGGYDGIYRLDDINCLSFNKILYRLCRQTDFTAVCYVTNMLHG